MTVQLSRAATAIDRWQSQPVSDLWIFSGNRVFGLFCSAGITTLLFHLYVDVALTKIELFFHVVAVALSVTLAWASLQTIASTVLRRQNKKLLVTGLFWIISLSTTVLAVLAIAFTHSTSDSLRLIFAKHLINTSTSTISPAHAFSMLFLFVAVLLWTLFQSTRLNFLQQQLESAQADSAKGCNSAIKKAKTLTLRVDRQDITVRVDQILYVKAIQNYTLFCLRVFGSTKTQSVLTRMTLRQATSAIQSSDFMNVHRSYVVNLRAVQKIETVEGKSYVRIENTEPVPISRARRSETKMKIQSLS